MNQENKEIKKIFDEFENRMWKGSPYLDAEMQEHTKWLKRQIMQKIKEERQKTCPYCGGSLV